MSDQGEFWGPEPRDRSVTYGAVALLGVVVVLALGLAWAVYATTMALIR